MSIILYDIPSKLPGRIVSPNTRKARYALQFKDIPFKIEWVEVSDIEATLKAIGAPPSSTYRDGKPLYSVPTIVDAETGKKVVDSMIIAEYLDETYPEKRTVFPPGTAAAISAFELCWQTEVVPHVGPLAIANVFPILNQKSQDRYREMLEKAHGRKLEEIFLPIEKRPEQLEKVIAGLGKIAVLLDKNGKDKLFFLGDVFSYADCIAGGWMAWVKESLNSDEWKTIADSDGGRWARLTEYCEHLSGST